MTFHILILYIEITAAVEKIYPAPLKKTQLAYLKIIFCFPWKVRFWIFARSQASLQNSSQDPINIAVKTLSSMGKFCL